MYFSFLENVQFVLAIIDEDFLQTPSADAPQEKEEPKNWNGHDLESGVEYVTAKYKGRWGTYTKADAEKFSLPTK